MCDCLCIVKVALSKHFPRLRQALLTQGMEIPDTDDEIAFPLHPMSTQPPAAAIDSQSFRELVPQPSEIPAGLRLPAPVPLDEMVLSSLRPEGEMVPPKAPPARPAPPAPPPLLRPRTRPPALFLPRRRTRSATPERGQRHAELHAFKCSECYVDQKVMHLSDRPLTPDPSDRTTSQREWYACRSRWEMQWQAHSLKCSGVADLVEMNFEVSSCERAWDKASRQHPPLLGPPRRANMGRDREIDQWKKQIVNDAREVLLEWIPVRVVTLRASIDNFTHARIESTTVAGEPVAVHKIPISASVTELKTVHKDLCDQLRVKHSCKLRMVLNDGHLIDLADGAKSAAQQLGLEELRKDLFLQGRAVTYSEMCAEMPQDWTAARMMDRWLKLTIVRPGVCQY